jgi:SAM-dependent methyltransferase
VPRWTVQARRFAHRVVHPQDVRNERFLAATYRSLLGRPMDPAGGSHYLRMLREGATRAEVVDDLKASDEYRRRVEQSTIGLPDLVAAAPERYTTLRRDDGTPVRTYVATDPDAFDWIEHAIMRNGFYEKPGVWVLDMDLDKRLMAEIVGSLEPKSVVEVGCSSGGVLACLHDAGIDVRGVDISTFARDRAPEAIRDRIRLGDLTELSFDRAFDVGFGLDIFEHIHPGKLDAFVGALAALVAPGGYLFVNVPAYGRDAVFGEAFPMTLHEWREDAARGRHFANLEVDERGYPVHGHLVLATTEWWVTRFEATGLQRAPEIERAIHGHYDAYFDAQSPARKPLYVFGKGVAAEEASALADRIRATPSRVLAGADAAGGGSGR